MQFVRFVVVWGILLALALYGNRNDKWVGPEAIAALSGSALGAGIIAYILYRFVPPLRRWVDGY
jgi:hypothetical protein